MKENLRAIWHRHFDNWDDICLDEAARLRAMNALFYLAIAAVGFVMSILNVRAGTYNLLVVTATLCVVFACFGVLLFLRRDILHISTPVVVVGGFTMCAYFLYSGGTEGFSIVWILLVPAFSYLILPRWPAWLLNTSLLLLVVVVFWTPAYSWLNYDYSVAFQQRFPVIMGFVVACGRISELVRYQTQRRLVAITSGLQKQALTDPLTGVGNRHAFRVDYDAAADGTCYSYAIVDVDYFKRINDTYGHDIGDCVLVDLARIITRHIRPGDKVYRWGGEEFLVVFCDLPAEMFAPTLDRLRQAVEEHIFTAEGKVLPPITISGGGVRRLEEWDGAQCIKIADQCLYRAKANGRNRMEVADERLLSEQGT